MFFEDFNQTAGSIKQIKIPCPNIIFRLFLSAYLTDSTDLNFNRSVQCKLTNENKKTLSSKYPAHVLYKKVM